MILSEIQIKVLKFLIEFKQLTIPQFIRLFDELFSYQKIYRNLKYLLDRRKPLIARVDYKKVNHIGKLSNVYNITRLGEKTFNDQTKQDSNSLIFSPLEPKLTTDYFHRTKTIDFHISLYKYLLNTEDTLKYCSHYFMVEKSGNNFVSKNKITYLNNKSVIPDSIYTIGDKTNQRYLLFEFHNGKDKQRILDQIEQHAIVLTGLYTHHKYKIPKNKFYYILIVFEEKSVMNGVISKLKEDKRYKNIVSFFLLKHLSELNENLFLDWINLKGDYANIRI